MLDALDLIGIFVFALSGASLAINKQLDLVGAVSLALVTGLAGGVLRDLFLGDIPPTAFRNQWFLVIPIFAAATVIVIPQVTSRFRRPVLVFDAIGLALFSVVGTAKAIEFGVGAGSAAMIGALSAVGGGIVRDVLVREIPETFTPDSGLYVIPAVAGGFAVAFAEQQNFAPTAVSVGAAVFVFVVRMLSVRFHWSTPRLGAALE